MLALSVARLNVAARNLRFNSRAIRPSVRDDFLWFELDNLHLCTFSGRAAVKQRETPFDTGVYVQQYVLNVFFAVLLLRKGPLGNLLRRRLTR